MTQLPYLKNGFIVQIWEKILFQLLNRTYNFEIYDLKYVDNSCLNIDFYNVRFFESEQYRTGIPIAGRSFINLLIKYVFNNYKYIFEMSKYICTDTITDSPPFQLDKTTELASPFLLQKVRLMISSLILLSLTYNHWLSYIVCRKDIKLQQLFFLILCYQVG